MTLSLHHQQLVALEQMSGVDRELVLVFRQQAERVHQKLHKQARGPEGGNGERTTPRAWMTESESMIYKPQHPEDNCGSGARNKCCCENQHTRDG